MSNQKVIKQLRLTARIKEPDDPTKDETLSFSIPLFGLWELVVIANIPSADKTESTVYVKIVEARHPTPVKNNFGRHSNGKTSTRSLDEESEIEYEESDVEDGGMGSLPAA